MMLLLVASVLFLCIISDNSRRDNDDYAAPRPWCCVTKGVNDISRNTMQCLENMPTNMTDSLVGKDPFNYPL